MNNTNNINDIEIRFIKEGGHYKMKEFNKKMLINNGHIFLVNKDIFYDDNIPKINMNNDKINIKDAFEHCHKIHSKHTKK